jgi:hypothetical protein
MSPLNGWQGEVGDKRNWETVLERNLYIHVLGDCFRKEFLLLKK